MYPAARMAVVLIWIVALLMLAGAVFSILAGFDVVKPLEQMHDFVPQGTTERTFFLVVGVNGVILSLFLLVWCDMVRAVVNTAVNTREMLRMMREGGGAGGRRLTVND
jgi:hypothetical protein